MKTGYIGNLKWKQISTKGCFRLHIYLRTNKTITHNSLHVFDNWGNNLSHEKILYSYSREMFTGRAKPFRIIGNPVNHRPDKWSSTIIRRIYFVVNKMFNIEAHYKQHFCKDEKRYPVDYTILVSGSRFAFCLSMGT